MASNPSANPSIWTIRFKHHKTTILLFVDPLSTLDQTKELLLRTIKQTHSSGEFNGLPIPEDINGIVLGVPVNRQDPGKGGWVNLKIPEIEVKDGKGGKQKVGGRDSAFNDSILGAGLKDGAIIAFKFAMDRVDGDDEEMDDVGGNERRFDVIIPTYDDELADPVH